MIHPGLIVLLASLLVLVQVGVVIWIRSDIRACEHRMEAHVAILAVEIKALGARLNDQVNSQAAMIRRTDDLVAMFAAISTQLDERALLDGLPRRRR